MNVIEAHRRAGERFCATVRAVPADGWSRVTPCADWDVRALVNHVVGEDRWTVPLMAGQTIASVGGTLAGDLLGADPAAAADRAWAEAAAVVPVGVSAGARVHLSYGEEVAEEYAWQLTSDHLIHTWDLAVAVGADPALDPDVVAAVAGWFGEREAALQATGLFAPPVPLPAGASRQDRLLATAGRDPRWNPSVGILHAFNAAFAAADLDRVMAMITEDCVLESTGPAPDGERYEGAAAVRAAWQELFSSTPALTCAVEQASADGDRGVLRWRFGWGGQRPGHVRGVDLIRLRDGKIAELLSYVKG